MQLQSEENFLDAEMKRPVDSSVYYNEKGVVIMRNYYENEKRAKLYQYYDNGNKKDILFYVLGKPSELTGWYENGNKRGVVVYDTAGKPNKQNGWDENGVEIPGYIYEQEARFPGGPQAWKAFLISKIKPNTAATRKTPNGVYTVKVQFVINKEGKVERAQAIEVPALCSKCGIEAVKIINSSPGWEHAIQYGKPVIYQAIQNISWQVED